MLASDHILYCISEKKNAFIYFFFAQSDVPIDLLDVDKNSAVVSFSECDSEVTHFHVSIFFMPLKASY